MMNKNKNFNDKEMTPKEYLAMKNQKRISKHGKKKRKK